ncbi:MAG: hypothetical protein CMH58_01950 [Myxococcales bacterium]|nr:hypothetical protein [Myxococcales bacterium]
MGDGNYESSAVPVAVINLEPVRKIVAGRLHNCALELDGDVRCWGYGLGGRLGDQQHRSRRAPIRVEGLAPAVAVAVGGGHGCALENDGRIGCWGANDFGQALAPAGDLPETPYFPELPEIVAMGLTQNSTCVADAAGRLACWGYGEQGQRAGSRTNLRWIRSLDGVHLIASGRSHHCALDGDNRLWCWGEGSSGQIGDGQRVDRQEPTLVEFH